MAKHIPPNVTSAAGYVESEVSRWIHCRIRGEKWTPGPIPEHPKIIRKKEALARTGLSNFTLWTLEQRDAFPRRIRLTDAADRAAVDEPVAPARIRRRRAA